MSTETTHCIPSHYKYIANIRVNFWAGIFDSHMGSISRSLDIFPLAT